MWTYFTLVYGFIDVNVMVKNKSNAFVCGKQLFFAVSQFGDSREGSLTGPSNTAERSEVLHN